MSDEIINVAEQESAPVQVETVSPEVVESTPETPEVPSKLFSQEELDAAIGKRLAREQRKWEREQQRSRSTGDVVPSVTNVSLDQFDSPESYAEFLAVQKAEAIVAAREQEREASHILDRYHDLEEETRTKYDDFDVVAYNPKLAITEVMAEAIRSSDIGPDVAYYLGSNPKEAVRISKLSYVGQARELGKIEAKLVLEPPVKRATSAPAPISPVSTRTISATSVDTTDPRSTSSMTTSQWIEAERARQRRKFEALRR